MQLRGGVVLRERSIDVDIDAEAPVEEVVLLDRAGRSLVDDPVAVARELEQMVDHSGERLFPQVHADVVAEDLEYQRWRGTTRWQGLPPSPALGYELENAPVGTLPTYELVEAARAHARMIAHHEALLADSLAELASRPEYGECTNPDSSERHDAVRVAASEVSLALTWTPSHADDQVRTAVELTSELPATFNALYDGVIDAYKARIIVNETRILAERPELRATVEQAALRVAGNKTGPALRAFIKRKIMALAPELVEAKRKTARTSRRVSSPFDQGDGMACMELYGPAADLAALHTAVDAAARARRDAAAKSGDRDHPDAGVSLEALRFDVLTGLGWSGLDAGHLGCCATTCTGSGGDSSGQRLGTRHGRAAAVNVTVPFTTLIGLDDQPGVLHGYGLIHPEVARRVAAEGTWRRILTDPATGAVLDVGTTRYRPPRHLADHVIARDGTCRFPTCGRDARGCELDHTTPFKVDGTGGGTSAGNLGAWDDRHHRDKTHHGFAVTQPEPGKFVITTPAGHIYTVPPHPAGPIIDPPRPEPDKPDPPRAGPDDVSPF
jgi:hypothetical protein